MAFCEKRICNVLNVIKSALFRAMMTNSVFVPQARRVIVLLFLS